MPVPAGGRVPAAATRPIASSRYEPLVPDDARQGADALTEARLLGRAFSELDEESGAEVRALVRWQDAVAASRRNRG
jgi:hypothetical protein